MTGRIAPASVLYRPFLGACGRACAPSSGSNPLARTSAPFAIIACAVWFYSHVGGRSGDSQSRRWGWVRRSAESKASESTDLSARSSPPCVWPRRRVVRPSWSCCCQLKMRRASLPHLPPKCSTVDTCRRWRGCSWSHEVCSSKTTIYKSCPAQCVTSSSNVIASYGTHPSVGSGSTNSQVSG